MKLEERTDLLRATAQILEWTKGLTNIQFEPLQCRLAEVSRESYTNYSFEVTTNQARLTGLVHPMALVVEAVSMVLTGVVRDKPEGLVFDNLVAEFDIDHMSDMLLVRDKGGFSNISVQVRYTQFDGGEERLARQFMFRNNLLHRIR